MDSRFGLPTKAVSAINGSSVALVQAASHIVLSTLTNGTATSTTTEDVPSALIDALSFVLAPALQRQSPPGALEELLSTSTSIRGELVKTIVAVFKASCQSSQDDTDSSRAVFEDGFFPRITGLQWSLSHALGDRMQDPPSRSLPSFDVSFKSIDSWHNRTDEFTVAIPAERLVDLHTTLRDMLKEGDRVARRGGN